MQSNPAQAAPGQAERVRDVMNDSRWWTFAEIKEETFRRFGKVDSEAAISARIREFDHDKRVRSGRLWEYRMVDPKLF